MAVACALAGGPAAARAIGAAHEQWIEVKAPNGGIVGYVVARHGRYEARDREGRLLGYWTLAQLHTTDPAGRSLGFGNWTLKVVVDNARRSGLLPQE
ncbi:MAG: hypothetical protein SF002_00820 [Alphaproteobacteria bacterium]|nr:hypothetical protein [Alphaproteobacteria bacterium]